MHRDARALDLCPCITRDVPYDARMMHRDALMRLKRRFFYVDNILKSFVETCSAKRGELKAELTSAKDLTEDEVNSIKEELTENFSSKIKLNYKYDKSLIGGLIVQVGSTMVDTSIKNKLQQIENRMIEA